MRRAARGWILPALAAVCVAASTLAPGGAARAATRPNFLIILTDDQTLDALQPGNPVVMPNLEAHLADPTDHWIDFQDAFFNNPLCCPSRATILTGLYSHHTGVESNDDGDKLDPTTTINSHLQAAGYRTGLIGKYLNGYPFGNPDTYIPPGWDYWAVKTGLLDLGYYNYTLNENGVLQTYKFGVRDYSTDLLTTKAQAFLDTEPAGQPFFLELALAAPHGPWQPAPGDDTAFPGLVPFHAPSFNEADVSDKPQWVKSLPTLGASQVAQMNADKVTHYQTIIDVDRAVQTLLDTLGANGQLDNTVILFMTDNGFTFGEHRWEGKRCEYEECIHTPFLVRFPGATPHVDTHLLLNTDIAPTFAALAGLSPPPPTDGVSFAPLLQGLPPPTWRHSVLIHNFGESKTPVPGFWGIRTQTWKYVELDTGEKELYDLANDPSELQNRAGNPAYASTQASLRQELGGYIGSDLGLSEVASPDPTAVGQQLTYSFTLSNAGPMDATSVSFTDPLPSQVTVAKVSSSKGSCVRAATVTCTFGTVQVGIPVTITIVTTAVQAGSPTNTATESAFHGDPNPANDLGTVTSTIDPAPPPPSGATVAVADFAFDPSGVRAGFGTSVQWNFNGPSTHTATETSGLALFDSGPHGPGTSFTYAVPAAGAYPYHCSIHPSVMSGTIKAPMTASPAAGGTSTSFALAWASGPPPAGLVYDVQIARPGGRFANWLTGLAAPSGAFVPDAGPGNYSFKARLRNASTGKALKYSPSVTISVS